MKPVVVVGVFIVSTVAMSASSTVAGQHFLSRQRVCNQRCVPNYQYRDDAPRFSATQFAVANSSVGQAAVQHKPFHFRATTLDIDHLHLDQVGLAIYKAHGSSDAAQGRVIATGRITHDGGDGGIIGSNITIRIRAYIAGNADPNQIPPDAFVIWESERQLWVRRGTPQYISLAPEELAQAEKLNIHFDDITHLEVELEYRRDR